jgi:hypothetical protein
MEIEIPRRVSFHRQRNKIIIQCWAKTSSCERIGNWRDIGIFMLG